MLQLLVRWAPGSFSAATYAHSAAQQAASRLLPDGGSSLHMPCMLHWRAKHWCSLSSAETAQPATVFTTCKLEQAFAAETSGCAREALCMLTPKVCKVHGPHLECLAPVCSRAVAVRVQTPPAAA